MVAGGGIRSEPTAFWINRVPRLSQPGPDPLASGREWRLRMGYFRRGSHRIVNLNHCPVLDPRLDS